MECDASATKDQAGRAPAGVCPLGELGGMPGASYLHAADDQIFQDGPEDDKNQDDDQKGDTGFAQITERFKKTISWLEPTQQKLREDMQQATQAQKTREVGRLKREIKRYEIFVSALKRLQRQLQQASDKGDVAKFKKSMRASDYLLDRFDAWRKAVEEQEEKGTGSTSGKPSSKVTRARRAVEAGIKKLGLDKLPPSREEERERVRREIERLRDRFQRGRRGRGGRR